MFNHAPNIIASILLSGLAELFGADSRHEGIALSSLFKHDPNRGQLLSLNLISSLHRFHILLSTQNFTESENIKLKSLLSASAADISWLMTALTRKNFTAFVETAEPAPDAVYTAFDVCVNKIEDRNIRVILPQEFFGLFIKKFDPISPPEKIESDFLEHFKNPFSIFPRLEHILDYLPDIQLQAVLNRLQKTNHLTPYQIFLATQAYPEHSLKIKNCLSKNSIEEVKKVISMKSALKISYRDLKAGIYSIEESIYFLLRNSTDTSYSRVLANINNIIRRSVNLSLLSERNFFEWFVLIKEKNLLYQTLSTLENSVTVRAISQNPAAFADLMSEAVSAKKIKDILDEDNKKFSQIEVMDSQVIFILNYRRQKFLRNNPRPGSFPFLVNSFINKDDFKHLLLSAGWFNLSTALKDSNKKTREKAIDPLPAPAKYLIEDVLRGVLNVNIIHDELQINKAKSICVKEINNLYETGLIDLEL